MLDGDGCATTNTVTAKHKPGYKNISNYLQN
jgi:hypothetical protein